jgi:hypothetical protein
VVLVLSALGEDGSLPLQRGDALPALVGQTLSGKMLDLPAVARGSAVVVIFSFSRAGGRDARNWAQQLSKDYPEVAVYNAIFLESVPRLLRNLVASGIHSVMPSAAQDRTLLLYQQQGSWEKMLQVQDENCASVVVLGPTGLIRSVSAGGFTEAIYARVKAELGSAG